MIELAGWYPWGNITRTQPPSDEYAFEMGVGAQFLFFVRKRVGGQWEYRLHSTSEFENGAYINPVAGPFDSQDAAVAAYLLLN